MAVTGMDRAEYVQKRRRKYLAQTLQFFEENIEPLVPQGKAEDFKGLVRAKMNALAVDAIDVMSMTPGESINGYAVQTTDRLYPNGRPHATRS